MLKRVIHTWERKLSRRDNNRVVRPFEWGTESLDPAHFTKSSGNGSDQREAIFSFNERAISESDKFFSLDAVPTFRFEDGWLAFQSAVKTAWARSCCAASLERQGARTRSLVRVAQPVWDRSPAVEHALSRSANAAGV